MPDLDMTILYVANPPRSAGFYADITDRPPVELSPGFAMFVLANGARLGLWKRGDVAPEVADTAPAGSEICFTVETADAVRAVHAEWSRRGLKIAQAPVEMDFGHTFVALDPDGHRLRVFAPSLRQETSDRELQHQA